jgi:hypothetical protein
MGRIYVGWVEEDTHVALGFCRNMIEKESLGLFVSEYTPVLNKEGQL